MTARQVCDSEYREAVNAGVCEGLLWGALVAAAVVAGFALTLRPLPF